MKLHNDKRSLALPNIYFSHLHLSLLLLLLPLAFLIPVTPALASETPCSNETLRENPGVSNLNSATGQPFDASLPDCRAFEQVSPVEKDGGSGGVLVFDSLRQADGGLPMQSLGDGSAITYPGEPFFEVKTNGSVAAQYTSVRSAGVWTTSVGDKLQPENVPVPVPPASAEEAPRAEVLEETPDGSKVFFLDEKSGPGITPDSNAAPGEPDLYEYTVPSPSEPMGDLVDLSVDKGGHADVQGILGIGGEGPEEGSYVYFVAGGILAQGPSKSGCEKGEGGQAIGEGCNLYLRHNDITTFIATLPPEDEQGAGNVASDFDWAPSRVNRTSEVSPNGRYVAFQNVISGGGSTGKPEVEDVLRYDADAGAATSLICVSCGTAGTPTSGHTGIARSSLAAINGANTQRNTLDDGRVLFTSEAPLVPDDVNHRADVYEWEPLGIGSCTENTSTGGSEFIPSQSGCISLISGGTSEVSSSIFTDASSNGSDIFFTTSQSLVPQDQDEITDLYDAREDGGTPPPPALACPLETPCPGPSAPPPALGAPASAAFSGPEPPPVLVPQTAVVPHAPTRADRLSKALRSCRAQKKKPKRVACERKARRAYGTKKAAKKANVNRGAK